MNAPCHISLLGPLRIQRENLLIQQFRTHKTGALLGYLAYHLHQAHTRDELIAMLWPDYEEHSGRGCLNVALWALRRLLETRGEEAGSVILADRFTVRLNPELVSTDVEVLKTLLTSASRADNLQSHIERLERAVDLYQGKLLTGYYEDWIEPEQQRLEDLAYDAAHQLTKLFFELGRFDRALDYARRAVRMNLLAEEAHEAIMDIQTKIGRPAAALQQYRTLERLLQQENLGPPCAVVRQRSRRIQAVVTHQRHTDANPGSIPHLPAKPAYLPAGTWTFLLSERPVAASEKRDRSLESANLSLRQEQWQAVLTREVARHSGCLVYPTQKEFVAAFPTAGTAFACAISCHCFLFSQAVLERREMVPLRMILYTRAVTGQGHPYPSAIPSWARHLPATTPAGCLLCSEATSVLLRAEIPLGNLLRDLDVDPLPAGTEERLFYFSWSGKIINPLSAA